MRHGKKTKILGRKTGPRKALMKSLCYSLVTYGRITTTEAKAKALRPVIEKLITKSKKGDLNARRNAIAVLGNAQIAAKLLGQIVPRYVERKGGYTRVLKLARRKSDAAKMALIEFV